MSFSFFNSFNGNSQRLGQNYSIVSQDVNPPGLVSSIGSDTSSVTFTFTAPRTGGTVTGYTAYVDGKPYSGTGGPSSYTINGLSAGGQYRINMVANIVSTSSTSTTVTSTFNPTSISGCAAWWDASDPYGTGTVPANGTAISTWTDKSGSGYNGIAQSGLTATYTSASKTLNFNNAYYTTNYPANPTYETCFMVFNHTDTANEMLLIGSTAGGRIVDIVNTGYSLGTSFVGGGSSSTGLSTNGTNDLAVTVINTNANSYSSTNGALTLNGPTAMGAFTAGKTTYLGRDGYPHIFYGNVCEILFYNVVLSASDRQKVEGYLAWKWSIQSKLPSGHPYYSTNGYITSSTVTTTTSKNVLSNPSQPLVISTLAPFPTNIQLISATTTSLTFSFTAPTTGSTPTGYVPYINGSAGTGSGTPSSYTISDLSGSTSYSVAMGASITTAGFSPTSITGCLLWLDASDNTSITYSSGSSINQWLDKSGSNNNATQSTTSLMPTYGTMSNGKNAINFSTGKCLSAPTVSLSTTYSVFVIGYTLIPQTYQYLLNFNNSVSGLFQFGTGGDRNFLTSVGITSWNDSTTNSPSSAVASLCMMEMTNNGTSSGLIPYFNGTTMSAKNGTTISQSDLTIGARFSKDGYFWNGYLAEIIIYNSVLSTSDRQKIEGYLAWKWGLQTSLPVAHPYYSSSFGTTTITYQNPTPVSLTTLYNYPTNIQLISATTTSLTISFTAPGNNPTGYTPYVNGSAGTGSGTPSSYTITGLNGSTSYQITMGASTSVTGTLNPTSISGCTAWWDGADPNGTGVLPANGASITTWADKSGNGYNATATSAATYSLSSKSVTFSNNYYTSNHPATPTNETCFIVYNVTNTNGYMFMIGTAYGGREIGINNTYTSVGIGNSGISWGAISTGVGTVGQSYLVTGQISNGPSNTYISVNGALTLIGPTAMGSSFTNGVTTGLGKEQAVNGPFYGNIMEVLFYNSVLSTSDRQKIEGYLAWKWSIQSKLPSGHPYYSAAPTGTVTTIYQNPTPSTLATKSNPPAVFTNYNSSTTNGAYKIYAYTTVGTYTNAITITAPVGLVIQIFAIAGGGSGGQDQGGGGGAGGVLQSSITISGSDTVSLTLGDGGPGTGSGANGSNTTVSFTNNTGNNMTCVGGGRGAGYSSVAGSGGSGGGGSYWTSTPPGTGTASQGNAGGAYGTSYGTNGGGGGAGAVGGAGTGTTNAGNGGDGIKINTTLLTYFAGSTYANYWWAGGGGGGGSSDNVYGGNGGKGGGGGGSANNYTAGTGDTNGINTGGNGTVGLAKTGGAGGTNTGGGGGGCSQSGGTIGGKGGSGIILIAVPN
jgi:hypothetical protein